MVLVKAGFAVESGGGALHALGIETVEAERADTEARGVVEVGVGVAAGADGGRGAGLAGGVADQTLVAVNDGHACRT